MGICGDSSLNPIQDGVMPLCFIDLFIYTAACLFFWVAAGWRLREILKLSRVDIPYTRLFLVKEVLNGFAAFLTFVRTLSYLVEGVPTYVTVSDLLVGASWIFAIVFGAVEYTRGLKTSWLLKAWWTVTFMAASFAFQTTITLGRQSGVYKPDFYVQMLNVIVGATLTIIGFFLNSVPPGYEQLESEVSSDEFAIDPKLTNPEKNAGFYSKLVFSWLNPLLALGFKRPLETSDLWELPADLTAKNTGDRFMQAWEQERLLHGEQASLVRTLRVSFGKLFLLAGVLKLAHDCLMFVQPVLLRAIISFVREPSGINVGLSYALGMFLASLLQSICLNQYFFFTYNVGMQMRTAIITAVYAKAFKLSNKARSERTVGEIVNLQAIDGNRLQELIPYLHVVWSAPFQLTVCLVMLYQVMGPAVFAGLFLMIITTPISGVIVKRLGAYQKEMMKHKDRRTKLLNEVLSGIRVIKVFVWENSFLQQITSIRNDELETLRRSTYLRAATLFFWTSTPILVSLTTFTTYTLLGNELTAERAFTAVALFNILRFPLSMLPMVITGLVEARVSMQRVLKFLLADELDDTAVKRSPLNDDAKGPVNAVEISNGTFQWSDDRPTLEGINLRVPRGKLTVLVGSVGSSKSSLLSAVLGEIHKVSGQVLVTGRVAYVSQNAWIQNGTLRDNILFGSAFDADKYEAVIAACELSQDLAMLPDGDHTEIGEKGINLSGGQKQRVAMARAVYQDYDVYLLDDPLSAVDAHVGKSIFDNCCCGVLKNKTRVLVTHQLQYINRADQVVLMKDGKIDEVGTYDELMQKGGTLCSLIKTHVKDAAEHPDDSQHAATKTDAAVAAKKPAAAGAKPAAKLVTAEERETGTVDFRVYKAYIAALGGALLTGSIVAVFSIETGMRVMSDFWLSFWSDHADGQPGYFMGAYTQYASSYPYLGIYASLSLVPAVTVLIRSVLIAIAGINSARTLHDSMLSTIVHSPMSFFDTTPLGRILNRLTKDVYTVDNELPRTLGMMMQMAFMTMSVLLVIGIITPFTFTFMLPLAALYRYIQKYYLQSSRELKRLEGISKSPVYAQFGETLNGVSVIRAFGRQSEFVYTNNQKLDLNLSAFYVMQTANRWLGLRLEFLGTVVVSVAGCFLVTQAANINPGFAGLALAYAQQLTGILNWLVRQYTDTETQMVSVERVLQYAELPTEGATVIEDSRPPANWPSEAKIQFRNVKLRYREGLELVLRGISFDVKPKEKIGVVGRTGAGKSSLMLALFRLVELAEGTITIDGVDISKMGLHDLRGALSIIMQDPTLFTGTVRSNLDPFGEHSDHQIWEALANVHLKDAIEALDQKLDSPVAEFGENFSVGQQQLLCLGRAILKKAKILVMDEATAAVDFETDALIQKTIREQFASTTVLTIAHRLNTIMDYDRILVLDRGLVGELDAPQTLLKDPNSMFSKLVNKSGTAKEEDVDAMLSPEPARFANI
eukprot:TRINITY_DN263_c0_g2_i2.p1 TRINITY_DN263_c0_g2~~TRINITY_DN263_c0_g2_i2.p1  ORF type:complete len:1470 (+),score=645.31 TRINITY_DN263_c0_g2_i2:96-4505(+)